MKKLYELIADAEAELPTADENRKPVLYSELSDMLSFVDPEKATAYEEKMLASALDTDSEMYLFARLAWGNSMVNYYKLEEAMSCALEVIEKSRASGKQKLLHDSLVLKAIIEYEQGKRKESKLTYESCLVLHPFFEDKVSRSHFYCMYARLYEDISRPEVGRLMLQAIKEVEGIDKPWVEAYIMYCMADWAKDMNDRDTTIHYLQKALDIFEEHRAIFWIANTLELMSDFHLMSKDYQQAYDAGKRALELMKIQGTPRDYAITLNNLLSPLIELNRLSEAEEYIAEGIAFCKEKGLNKQLGFSYSKQSTIALLKGNAQKSIECAQLAIETYGKEGTLSYTVPVKDKLATAYAAASDYENAYLTLRSFIEGKLTMINEKQTKEVMELKSKYETEKREVELRETKLQQTESELKAIKAQMNPHFIFNALNSIQEMFFIGDKRLANEHLGKFSQLTREILKASGKQFISLTEEIEMLTKYLELEGLRFEKDFSFNIKLNDENAADDILLPPMLIQPYIENAIRHGLLHKKGEKKIEIDFNFNEQKKILTCTVYDNGIGRNAADEINKNRSQLHESFSTSANEKRLELLNQNRVEKIGVQYQDLENGTKVSILIPVAYD
jgi:tetratricopeptide (TPR) repeat protein